MSEIDAATLQRASAPAVELLGLETLRADGAASAVAGFDAFGRLYVAAAVAEFRAGSRSDAVTVTVEQSADGISWAAAAVFVFASDGVQFATIDAPADQLRVSWVFSGRLRSCRVVGVTATPGSLDPASGAGGYVPPTARGQFGGVSAAGPTTDPTIADNAQDILPWRQISIPNNVLDLSDPFNPAVLESGIHAVSVSILPYDLTSGGYFQGVLAMAYDNEDSETDGDSRLAADSDAITGHHPELHLAATYYIPAGGTLRVKLYNYDGVSAQRFGIDVAMVQRLT